MASAALAGALIHQGDPVAAEAVLRRVPPHGRRPDTHAEARLAHQRAIALAEAAGARPVQHAARYGLVALGSRPRRRSSTGGPALTAGERRVAELAARGTSNREIAEQLFLTLKTVENHLTATYRELGIGSRSQLADRLG